MRSELSLKSGGSRAEETGGMRNIAIVLALLLAASGAHAPPVGATSGPSPVLALAGIAHALDGATLVVTGAVENRSLRPVGALVVDATGLTASGNPSFFGSDGIPWTIAPGAAAGFAIRLPLRGDFVRDYVVQVAATAAPSRPLASVRRTVAPALYRLLLIASVRLTGEIRSDRLTVHSDRQGWPIDSITAEAMVSLPAFARRGVIGVGRIETVVVEVPGDASTTIGLGVFGARLLSLRATNVRTRTTWSD
jgi:hypothetical protein